MKKIIIANWKCNPATAKEAQKLFLALKAGAKKTKPEMVVCPPFVYLPEAARILKPLGIKLGGQNCFWEEKGAFTGEVSPVMLKNLGVNYVLLGHSERVMILGETNEMTAKKVKAALLAGLTPIVCLGEDLAEKSSGQTFQIIEKELKESLALLAKNQIKGVVIVYEPLWAISTAGNSHSCSPDDALTVILFLRKLLSKMAGSKAGRVLPILYGGSVNSKNAKDYLQSEAISGLLVGGASLDIREFLKIFQSDVY